MLWRLFHTLIRLDSVSKNNHELEQRIQHTFGNAALLKEALTHCSAAAKNNERLEFIGDSIVNFVIAEALDDKFPKAKEGELSRLRSHLVRGDTLANIAREINLGDYLKLGQGELHSGGKRRTSILADAVEALIAAIYLDSDLSTCKQVVLGWFQQRLAAATLTANSKDAKTLLQEYLQSKRQPLPVYEVEKTEGSAHAQTFTVTATATDSGLSAQGSGTSRRKAEQQAAQLLLKMLKEKPKPWALPIGSKFYCHWQFW